MASDVDFFQEEAAGQGEAWGEVRLLQASILGVLEVCLLPHLHYPPYKLWIAAAQVLMAIDWSGL